MSQEPCERRRAPAAPPVGVLLCEASLTALPSRAILCGTTAVVAAFLGVAADHDDAAATLDLTWMTSKRSCPLNRRAPAQAGASPLGVAEVLHHLWLRGGIGPS